jgi:AraC-like DNA-binding protein
MPGFPPFAVPVQSWRTRSIDQAQGHMSGVFAEHRLEGRGGELDFEHFTLTGPRLSLHRLRYGAEVLVDAPALERFYLLQLTLTGACEITQGRRTSTVREGELLVISPMQPYRKRWSASCSQLIVRLDRNLVEEAWGDRYGPETSQALEFAFAKAPPVSAAHLRAALSAAGSRDQTERTIADALVAALPPDASDTGSPAASRLVRRAEAFMESFLAQDLAITEVARATGVTTRSLERAFRQVRGSTIVACLRRLRLERAQRALQSAGDDGRTVTEIAISLGLLHPGRFSMAYKRQFGEAPSETLRSARHRLDAA